MVGWNRIRLGWVVMWVVVGVGCGGGGGGGVDLGVEVGGTDATGEVTVEVMGGDVEVAGNDVVETAGEDLGGLETVESEVGGPLCGDDAECDDGNPCTEDTCLPETGCRNEPTTGSCDDGNPCTEGDQCVEGGCAAGPDAKDCDDGNVCTDDSCEPEVGCVYENNTAPCDDGNACTEGDACSDGGCSSGPNLCGCLSDAECAQLDDGNLCNGSFFCDEQQDPPACVLDLESVVVCSGTPPSPCTQWACQPETGACVEVPANEGDPCDDADFCTADDQCVAGGCTGMPIPACGIGEPCATEGDCLPDLTCFASMPGGYCTILNCTIVGCPAGTVCGNINDGEMQVCLAACDGDADCRQDEGHGCTADGGCWCGEEICQAGETVCVGNLLGTCNACGSALEPGAIDCTDQDLLCHEGQCVECIPGECPEE